MNYLNIMNSVHYIHLVFLHPTFHAPTVHIPLHHILLYVLAPSSRSITFNSSIFDTTSGSKHLSKRVGKMQDEFLLAAIKQGSFVHCVIQNTWAGKSEQIKWPDYRAGRSEILFPTEATDFFLLQNVQAISGAHPFPCWMGNEMFFHLGLRSWGVKSTLFRLCWG